MLLFHFNSLPHTKPNDLLQNYFNKCLVKDILFSIAVSWGLIKFSLSPISTITSINTEEPLYTSELITSDVHSYFYI